MGGGVSLQQLQPTDHGSDESLAQPAVGLAKLSEHCDARVSAHTRHELNVLGQDVAHRSLAYENARRNAQQRYDLWQAEHQTRAAESDESGADLLQLSDSQWRRIR